MVKTQKLQKSEVASFHFILHLVPLLEERNVIGFSVFFQGDVCVCVCVCVCIVCVHSFGFHFKNYSDVSQ